MTVSLDAVKDERFIYLTTKGRKTGNPHQVELWFAPEGGKVYLSHEGKATDWMKNIEKSGKVSARIGSVNFDAQARLTENGSDSRESGKRALYTKYYGPAAKSVLDDWFELSTVIELSPTG